MVSLFGDKDGEVSERAFVTSQGPQRIREGARVSLIGRLFLPMGFPAPEAEPEPVLAGVSFSISFLRAVPTSGPGGVF